jgi:hypothetical protein
MRRTPLGKHGDTEITCPDCSTTVPLHGLFWCAEVCPKCIKTFEYGYAGDYNLYRGIGFYYGDARAQVQRNIAKHGGRYIPHFDHDRPEACGHYCQKGA